MAALACLHHVCSVTVGYLSGSVGITLQASVQFPWFTLLIVVLLNVRLILFSAAWLIRQNRIVLSLDKVIWSEQIAPCAIRGSVMRHAKSVRYCIRGFNL